MALSAISGRLPGGKIIGGSFRGVSDRAGNTRKNDGHEAGAMGIFLYQLECEYRQENHDNPSPECSVSKESGQIKG